MLVFERDYMETEYLDLTTTSAICGLIGPGMPLFHFYLHRTSEH